MGGWGSGQSSGRPVKEGGLTIDLARVLREGWIRDGARLAGTMSWSWGGESRSTIGYSSNLADPDNASLTLDYRQRRGGEDWVERKQHIRLTYTQPPYGGRRWWMLCPARGDRVGKLYLPSGGDIFAGRKAWRLGYRSQRVARRDRPLERLNALERKLGCVDGLVRPKGMWRRTFERHLDRYYELDQQCAIELMQFVMRFGGRLDSIGK